MSLQPAKLLVQVGEREVRLRITGRANFTSGPDFKNLITGLHDKGYRHFVIEMSDCVLMDSTFLGLLCGLALKVHDSGSADAGVELLNPNPRVAEILESLGVTGVLKLVNTSMPTEPVSDATVHSCAPHTREEMAQTSLEAHETLMALSPENTARFKDVAKFLAEDLQRLRAAG